MADRSQRRRSLLYFAQLSDFQLADEESPARVEFVDLTANPPSTSIFSAAQRPQEALVAQAAESSIRQVNRFGSSPVAQAGNARAKLAFSVFTGDLADSPQLNESRAVLGLLEGGPVNPNSGVDNAGCPPGTPAPPRPPATPASRTRTTWWRARSSTTPTTRPARMPRSRGGRG